jgi:hypothetical protein
MMNDIMVHPIFRHLAKFAFEYTPGNTVRPAPDRSVNIIEMLGKPDLKFVLAGPLRKCVNPEVIKWPDNPVVEGEIDPDAIRGGARLHYTDEVYQEAYDFKPYILNHQYVFPREVGLRDYQPEEGKMRTHLAVERLENLMAAESAKSLERYERELSYKNIFSEQVPDTPRLRADHYVTRKMIKKAVTFHEREKLRLSLTYVPDAVNWGLLQNSKDKPSFKAGVAQRIRRRTYLQNKIEVQDGEAYGGAMWEAFHRYMSWGAKIPWDAELYSDCEILFQMRRAERPAFLKKASLNRASPEWIDMLTGKTQWKLKSRENKNASPLQTILIRSDKVLFRDGPLGIYLLHQLLANCPKYVWFHAKKSFEQMAQWIAAQYEPDLFEMCDIEGFDSSIRGADVTLETNFMVHFGVPQEHITAYVEDKLDFHTRTIHFGIMRFSGEIFTWLFNSVHTLAREVLKYDHHPGDPIAVSGDDVLKWRVRGLSVRWERWKEQDPSIEKRYQDKRGEFCSFIVYKGKIFKDPIILFRRLMGQREQGKADQIALGYFEMFTYQYRLAENLYDVMTEEELRYAGAINMIMFNWKKVMGSTAHFDWSKASVGYEMDITGSREQAIKQLEGLEPRSLTEISTADIVTTSVPGVSFSYLWDDD